MTVWGIISTIILPDSVVQACGSGGTAAGMALGCHLSGCGLQVHAYGVCDTPDIFYDNIDALLEGMGATPDTVGEACPMELTYSSMQDLLQW